jgi:hypothetical protein
LANEDHVDRKRLIAGAVLLVILTILCISGSSLLLNEWRGKRGQVGHRVPLAGLGYCSSQQVRPCILSFNLNPGGGMLINVLVRGSTPDFYVRVKHDGGEDMYACRHAGLYSTRVLCTGKTMPVGKTMSFRLVSIEEDTTLAEGSFPIIGMALATPQVYFTPTPVLIDRLPR